MACWRTEDRRADGPDGGYATAAALSVSLAVAILAAALVMRGVAALKLARADFRRSQAEYALSGAQALAVTRLLKSSSSGRLAWSAGGLDPRGMSLLAEPEAPKLALAAAAELDDKALTALGAADPDQARLRLAGLEAASATPDQVQAADEASDWRVCAVSAISPWGLAQAVSLGPIREPDQEPGAARAGQVWRIVARTEDGWTDERIVRLIGRAETPGAIIWRRFGRGAGKGVTCDKTIEVSARGEGAPDKTPATP
ncbi:hypothetical protein ASD21_22955 [Caulobacter sp. Root1455]|uniref:hypothetical protein n=1 Tax=Caulobacter sp. Root1455 TaxID=1736465 RepID=UPI0006FB708F|nr:hypothetical protein [Caulobacter sp. Root1455]KQY96872.1 hypothetical protein ASD21_22955 [Caulobacter sp. Root1455]